MNEFCVLAPFPLLLDARFAKRSAEASDSLRVRSDLAANSEIVMLVPSQIDFPFRSCPSVTAVTACCSTPGFHLYSCWRRRFTLLDGGLPEIPANEQVGIRPDYYCLSG